MVQVLPSAGSASGRIGKAIGEGFSKGLSESVPKEAERYRLSAGLKQFEQESANLTPMQQLARLSSIPGITPQTIASFAELAKQQNTKNAYANTARGERGPIEKPKKGPEFKVNEGINNRKQGKIGEVDNGQRTPNVRSEEFGQPQINENSPLRDEAIPAIPSSPEQRDAEISNLIQQGFTPEQAEAKQADNERIRLSLPTAHQNVDKYLDDQAKKLDTEFTNQLETKLQKTGPGVYTDITGENLQNARRGLERDLRQNPNATIKDLANDWSNRMLNFAKTKSQFKKLAGSENGLNILLNKERTGDKLNEYSDIYKKSGNSEEYFNTLKSDLGLSPQGAASVAYHPSKPIKDYIDKSKNLRFYRSEAQQAQKMAIDLEDLGIGPDESLLSLAWNLRQKHPYFDQRSFFKQLSDDKDRLGLTDRQKNELAEGQSDFFPNWGDLLVLPFKEGSR